MSSYVFPTHFFPQNLFALSLNEPHNVQIKGASAKNSRFSSFHVATSSCLLFGCRFLLESSPLPPTPPWVSHPYSVVFKPAVHSDLWRLWVWTLDFCKAPLCTHTTGWLPEVSLGWLRVLGWDMGPQPAWPCFSLAIPVLVAGEPAKEEAAEWLSQVHSALDFTLR